MNRRATIAGVVAVAIAVAAAAVVLVGTRSDPWADLINALQPSRGVHGRFAVLDDPPPVPSLRSFVGSKTSDQADVRRLALAVLASNHSDHQGAIAEWLVGRTAEAQRRLQELARTSRSAEVWNDLAVMLAESASAVDDETLFLALAATDRAIDLDPSLETARFNRALVIDQLGLRDLARRAYEEYCRLDVASERAVEARARIRALEATGRSEGSIRQRSDALLDAAAAGDEAAIVAAVSASPQDARTFCLAELFAMWGESLTQRAVERAQTSLTLARVIGRTLQRINGDSLILDAVGAIDAASGNEARLSRLAEAHVTYGRASRLYRERRIAEAAELYVKARSSFETAESPAALWAAYYCASAATDVGAKGQALEEISSLERATEDRYPTVRAHTMRLRGTVMAFDGFVGEALDSYRSAHSAFVSLGENGNVVDTTARIAAVLTVLGRPGESWRLHRQSLREAGALREPRLIQSALHSAMFVALEEERWDVAHALLSLEVAVADANPRIHAEALVWRALAAKRAGMERSAMTALAAARRAAVDIVDPTFREGAENDLRLVEAIMAEEAAPERARALFSEYITITNRHHRLTRLPQVLVARSRTLQRLGLMDEAERDLRHAIALVEERHDRVADELIRDTFLGKAGDAYDHLADLLDRRGDVREAIATADRPRARLLADRRRGTWPVPDAGTVILSFGLYEDRTVTHVVSRGGSQRFEHPTGAASLRGTIDAFARAARDDQATILRTEGRRLYDALVAPAFTALTGVEKIIFIADAPLDRIPFAALTGPEGRFLIEDHAIAVAPGLRAYANDKPQRIGNGSVVAIGNPQFDRRSHPSLPPLPGAAEEARGAAALYRGSEVLIGEEATRARTLAALRRARIAHFGTHAILDSARPGRSRLLLAGGDELTASEIAEMTFGHLDTVVLAGCRTAASGAAYGFVQNLAAAFQAAGAKRVIGTLWDVEDAATRDLSLAVHRAISQGIPPDRALRAAQVQAISGPTSAWSALQLYEVQ